MIAMFRRLSLSRKILFGIVPLFLVFISISVILHNYFQEREMMDQARVSAETYANIIKESLVTMMVNDSKVDESFLRRVNEIGEFDTVHILANELKIRPEFLTSENIHRLTTRYKTIVPHDTVEVGVLKTGMPRFQRYDTRFRAIIPFNTSKVCQECHAVPIGYTLGAADLWISFEQVSAAAQATWRRSLLIFLAFAGLAITIATVIFSRYVSKPIDRLVQATRAISAGNLDDPVPDAVLTKSNDELQFLALRFDEMRGALREKISQLDNVNRNLSIRNKEVEEALRQVKLAQQELVRTERLAATGRMTAQLSHEINNPIHNIQSLLETTLRKLSPASKESELVGVALEEVMRMAKLTRQMLDVYRDSMVEMEYAQVNLRDTVEDTIKTTEESLAKHGIRVSMSFPRNLPPVRGAKDRLKQVFLNLILNARDAMDGRGGTIAITGTVHHDEILVDVKDTGTGIAPEHIDRIFDAFFTTKKDVSGVGLGLAVTYGIVQQHAGSIAVQSKIGEGTIFTLRFPVNHDH